MISNSPLVSSMRVMGIFSLLVGAFLAIAGMYKGLNLLELSALCGVFVGAAFGGKVAQKKIESDNSQ